MVMAVRRNFSMGGDNVDILLIIFKLLIKCSVNRHSQNALPFLHRKENDPCYGNNHKKCASLAAIPRTQVYYNNLHSRPRSLQTFLSDGHISYYSNVRGPDIIVIRNLSVSG